MFIDGCPLWVLKAYRKNFTPTSWLAWVTNIRHTVSVYKYISLNIYMYNNHSVPLNSIVYWQLNTRLVSYCPVTRSPCLRPFLCNKVPMSAHFNFFLSPFGKTLRVNLKLNHGSIIIQVGLFRNALFKKISKLSFLSTDCRFTMMVIKCTVSLTDMTKARLRLEQILGNQYCC